MINDTCMLILNAYTYVTVNAYTYVTVGIVVLNMFHICTSELILINMIFI